MMRTLLLVLSVMAMFWWGCGGGHRVQTPPVTDRALKAMPEWYRQVPRDSSYLYATATATSQDMDLATRKATQLARAEIGRQMDAHLQGLVKSFTEEVGGGEDAELLSQFTEVSKTVTNQVLVGSQVVRQKVIKDGPVYRAFVLMRMPVGAANKAFLERLKQQKQLYTRMRATRAFKELEEAVKQNQ